MTFFATSTSAAHRPHPSDNQELLVLGKVADLVGRHLGTRRVVVAHRHIAPPFNLLVA